MSGDDSRPMKGYVVYPTYRIVDDASFSDANVQR